jgi:uncharacterized protein (DUF362 family)
LHTKNIERITAEINKAVWPDLIIMDARKIFVTGGPDKGKVKDFGYIFASGDRTAIDLISLDDLLIEAKGEDNFLNKKRAEDYDQIKHAMKIGIGIKNRKEVRVVSG